MCPWWKLDPDASAAVILFEDGLALSFDLDCSVAVFPELSRRRSGNWEPLRKWKPVVSPLSNRPRLRQFVYHTAMTAFASQCTKEGYAIGADSLRMDMHGKIVTERAVKIYETGHQDFAGAYGFAGMTAFEFADGRILDVLELAKAVSAGLLAEHSGSAEEYADRFCNKLAANIQAGCAGIAIPHSFRLRGMFLGHSKGQGACVQMGFPFINGYLLRPVLEASFLNPVDRYCILSGSAAVLDEMNEQVGGPQTLDEATEWVRDYITRCINNTTDPYCKNVGGKAQVATVTPDKGFSWVSRP